MNPKAMVPYGLALRAYYNGDAEARLMARRDDGTDAPLPVSHFFRTPEQFFPIEVAALERCRGHVLDIGAGTGLHSLVLQSRGLPVTAIDICPQAVEIMTQLGVEDVRCADILDFDGGPYDSLLMLGHGIGIVEELAGLDRFLAHALSLIRNDGQVLLNSYDVRKTTDSGNLAYHEANRRAGRYIGEIRMRFVFEDETGPLCGWLHVDPETLQRHAEQAGWWSETILEEETGDYLARLTRQ